MTKLIPEDNVKGKTRLNREKPLKPAPKKLNTENISVIPERLPVLPVDSVVTPPLPDSSTPPAQRMPMLTVYDILSELFDTIEQLIESVDDAKIKKAATDKLNNTRLTYDVGIPKGRPDKYTNAIADAKRKKKDERT